MLAGASIPVSADGGSLTKDRFIGGRYPVTPDGRYFVVRGRLWRMSDPSLPDDRRELLVADLMRARRDVRLARLAGDTAAEAAARARVDTAKQALGERGDAWWSDGAPDLNRHMIHNSPYWEWFAALPTTSPIEKP